MRPTVLFSALDSLHLVEKCRRDGVPEELIRDVVRRVMTDNLLDYAEALRERGLSEMGASAAVFEQIAALYRQTEMIRTEVESLIQEAAQSL